MTMVSEVFHRHEFATVSTGGKFTNPFAYRPSDECKEAAAIVRRHINSEHRDWVDELGRGKMLGVLVCSNANGETGFLAAFSGTIGGRLNHEWFVPAVLDYEQPDGVFKTEEAQISALNGQIRALSESAEHRNALAEYEALKRQSEAELAKAKDDYAANKQARKAEREQHPELKDELDAKSQFEKAEIKRLKLRWEERLAQIDAQINGFKSQISSLKAERVRRSNILQRWLFMTMKLHRADGKALSVRDIFLRFRHIEPPSGAGECCAPRLLDYAFANGLTPVSMAEFWVGESPVGEIRIDGEFYPACQAKCAPLLKWMLTGVECETAQFETGTECQSNSSQTPSDGHSDSLQILFEDQWLLVVNKPAGLLTVSENSNLDTLMRRVLSMRPDITGPGYVHRLDQPTSGIVVIAKDKETHAKMQAMFEHREVKKRYVALLEKRPSADSGVITLPLLPNPDDRPRQMIDFVRGKKAVTRYEVIGTDSAGRAKVYFYPETGRTHQLRVHAASPMGLGCPIVGDNLYGHLGKRLCLHANRIEFRHPHTRALIIVECEAEF